FRREILRRCVAQLCVQQGWDRAEQSALRVLAQILEAYVFMLAGSAKVYTDQFEQTELTLNNLHLAFLKCNIQFDQLKEYFKLNEPVTLPHDVPHFP
ncbi:hypothetical protein HELRODRAFT_127881, partial [Helobdella robusta]